MRHIKIEFRQYSEISDRFNQLGSQSEEFRRSLFSVALAECPDNLKLTTRSNFAVAGESRKRRIMPEILRAGL